MFHEKVCAHFSNPKALITFAYSKANLKNHEKLQEKSKNWFSDKATHCAITAHALEAIAVDNLFNKKVRCFCERPLADKTSFYNELLKNELHFYRITICKGLFAHVFTIIKFPSENTLPYYLFYQSYYGEYTLPEFINSKSFRLHFFHTLEEQVLNPLMTIALHSSEWNQIHHAAYQKLAKISIDGHGGKNMCTPQFSTVLIRSFKKID